MSKRKQSKVLEIEKGLEDKRTEERLGLKKLSTKPNSELFFTDKSGNEDIRASLRHRKLRIDEILNPQSGIQGIASRKTKGSTIILESNASSTNAKDKKASKSVTRKIQELAERKKANPNAPTLKQLKELKKKSKTQEVELAKGGYSLWSTTQVQEEINEYLEPVRVKPVKKPKLPMEKHHITSQVQVAHQGASYRPKFEDHQSLLALALQEEELKIQAKEKIDKKLSYPKELNDYSDDETWLNKNEEEDTPNEDKVSHSIKPLQKRKTKAQRNKDKRQKELELQAQARNQELKIVKQINQLNSIQKELQSTASCIGKENTKKRAKKLGPRVFQPSPLELQLTEELTDSLRTLKPEGNNFKDRFESLQKRQLIEPRVPSTRKTKKVKLVESHDYKRFQ